MNQQVNVVHFKMIINMKIINYRITNNYRINNLKNERIVNKVRI
jgi:hypothetical protein